MEYQVESPRLRKSQLSVRWCGGDDLKGSVSPCSKICPICMGKPIAILLNVNGKACAGPST